MNNKSKRINLEEKTVLLQFYDGYQQNKFRIEDLPDGLDIQILQDYKIVNSLREGDTILSEETMIEIGQSKVKLFENQRTEEDKQNEVIIKKLKKELKLLDEEYIKKQLDVYGEFNTSCGYDTWEFDIFTKRRLLRKLLGDKK